MTTPRAIAAYAAAALLLIAGSGWLLSLVLSGDAARHALVVSAAVAFVVQLLAFVIARRFSDRSNAMLGWGIGALLCFVTLVVMGIVARPLGLSLEAALLGLATFLFLTELVEPLLLNR